MYMVILSLVLYVETMRYHQGSYIVVISYFHHFEWYLLCHAPGCGFKDDSIIPTTVTFGGENQGDAV